MKTLVFLALLGAAFAAAADDKIAGGYECPKHSVPYHALLVNGYYFCSGALISSLWVLSAARCYKSRVQVRLGEGTEQIINSAKVIRHPFYNSFNQDNNIMLIKLSRPAAINGYVQTVPLPSRCPVANEMCLVSGWGSLAADGSYYSTRLVCARQPILEDGICRNIYGSSSNTNTVCSGFIQGGPGSCQGDSGIPLVCNGQLQGVFVQGGECTMPVGPSLFTRVCRYNSWINGIMQNN